MSRETTIGPDTRVTLKFVGGLLSAAFLTGVLWFKIDAAQKDLRDIKGRMWSIPHQAIWADRLRIENPSIKTPPVEDVVQLVNGKATQ